MSFPPLGVNACSSRGPACRSLAAAVVVAVLALVGSCSAGLTQDDQPASKIEALMASSQVAEAAQVACEWAARDPGDLQALRICAELGRRAGRYRAAEDAVRSLLFFEPNVPDTLVMLGDLLTDEGRYDEARERFEQAIHLDDSHVGAFVGLARLERYTSDVEADVLSAAEVAVSVGPGDPRPLTALAEAKLDEGRYDEAIELLSEALQRDPDHGRARYDLGLARARQGDMEQARQEWNRYVELEPATGEAWRLRNNLVITGTEELGDRAWYASYSPDGARMAYRGRGAGGWGIYVAPADRPDQEQLLWATESNIQSLDWSPDGSQLLMRIYEQMMIEENGKSSKQWAYRLALLPTSGPAEAKYIYDGRWLGEPSWIPATGMIGAREYVRQKGYVLVSINPQTGESTEIPGTDASLPSYTPRWSADGKRVLLVRRGELLPDGTYSYQLLSGPADDLSKAQVIYENLEWIRTPRFSPDGSVILFNLAISASTTRFPTWAMPADGSREPCLMDWRAGAYTAPEMSPDGGRMLAGRDYTLVKLTLTGLRGSG